MGVAFDDENQEIVEKWYGRELLLKINVPFCYQSERSGMGDTTYHPIVWYKTRMALPETWQDKKVLQNFEAVDYQFDLWVNQIHIGSQQGGKLPGTFDVSDCLREDENEICLRVSNKMDWTKPPGKQTPFMSVDRCWYTQLMDVMQEVKIKSEKLWMRKSEFTHSS